MVPARAAPEQSRAVTLPPPSNTQVAPQIISRTPAPADAAYFSAWMDRVVEAALARGGWNSEQEKTDTLAYLESARARFRALATQKGNATP